MVVSITCDGCDAYAETSVGIDDGANAIEAVLDTGWQHEGGEDFCPSCVANGFAS
jgi:hypothetical protein